MDAKSGMRESRGFGNSTTTIGGESSRLRAVRPAHLLEAERDQFARCHTMAEYYRRYGIAPGSREGNEALIRSHVAYWSGYATARRIELKPMRVWALKCGKDDMYEIVGDWWWQTCTVIIADPYDHREGVVGWIDGRGVEEGGAS